MPVYKYHTKRGYMYYVKINLNGHQIIKRGFLDKKDAILFEAKALNSSGLKKRKVEPTCNELTSSFEKYLYQKYKESSAYRYTSLYNSYILPFFKNYKVKNITNFVLDQYNQYINRVNYQDKKNIIFLAKVYLQFLKNYDLDLSLNVNNLFVFKTQYVERKKFDYYTVDEFNQFYSVIDNIKFKLIFELLFDYGLRIGELRGLKQEDIDFKLNKLFIKRSINNKTGSKGQKITSVKTASSYRDYPLIPSIKTLLIKYLDTYHDSRNKFLFPAEKGKGKAIGETTIKRAQIEYCNRSGIRVIKLHEFRHSCATYLFNKGANIDLVASWLGHSDSSVTMRVYAHLLPSRKNEMLKFFDDP